MTFSNSMAKNSQADSRHPTPSNQMEFLAPFVKVNQNPTKNQRNRDVVGKSVQELRKNNLSAGNIGNGLGGSQINKDSSSNIDSESNGSDQFKKKINELKHHESSSPD